MTLAAKPRVQTVQRSPRRKMTMTFSPKDRESQTCLIAYSFPADFFEPPKKFGGSLTKWKSFNSKPVQPPSSEKPLFVYHPLITINKWVRVFYCRQEWEVNTSRKQKKTTNSLDDQDRACANNDPCSVWTKFLSSSEERLRVPLFVFVGMKARSNCSQDKRWKWIQRYL